ncbi:precursor of CEP9-like [Mercurialis annua]|uniref:precursor of CEP9-like n=1 Tax=Mercurialis annua TaxID=3986 RepID=UPI00215F7C45|nr:precursor of CEP9-like [Mercurialis annua]
MIMAETHYFFRHALFLLTFISCLQILFTEARLIKSTNKQELGRSVNLHRVKDSLSGQEQTQTDRSRVSAAPTSQDAFRPTTPGVSPGVGHHKAVELAASSDIEHSFTRFKDNYKNHPEIHKESVSETEKLPSTVSEASAAESKDDFRPTAPGYSLGVGHPKEVSGNEHFVAGNKDDYRPTQPGHSPGVGHSYHNAEQNP